MDFKEALTTRRSIRNYTDEAVTVDEIKSVVELARFAPSWKNSQTIRYVAILDKELKNKIANECTAGFTWNTGNITKAPALILVLTQDGKSGYESDGSFTTTKGTHWQSFDAGIATQSLCLAAHSLGLGTLIMGIYSEADVKKVAGVPDGFSVSALVAIGHYDKVQATPARLGVDELLSFK